MNLIGGLSDKYDYELIMTMEHSDMKVTTNAIKSKLLDMAVEVPSTGSELASREFSKPFYVKNRNGGSSVKCDKIWQFQISQIDKHDVKCYHCKKFEHCAFGCADLRSSVHLACKVYWLLNQRIDVVEMITNVNNWNFNIIRCTY